MPVNGALWHDAAARGTVPPRFQSLVDRRLADGLAASDKAGG
jgi:hypothetical protein